MRDEIKTAVLKRLKETRTDLFSTLNKLDSAQWDAEVYTSEADAKWTVSDIVRHLLSAEKGMTFLMQKILKTGEGVPEDFDRERYNKGQVNKIKEKTPDQLLQEMGENRQQLLHFIDSLREEDWQKNGRHGGGAILTLEEICLIIANHEADHRSEILNKVGN